MKVVCVMVTYNPDAEKILSVCKSVYDSVQSLVIVKNSPEELSEEILSFPNIFVIQLSRNFGIAYAQNRGIEYATENGADWVLLSDQDTVYPKGYVSKMLEISRRDNLKNIGTLTPIFFDEVKCDYAKIMISKTKSRAVRHGDGKIYEIAHNISSGTLIPVSVFDKCGVMDENLYIDFVDHEYCWRVQKYGLKNYLISDVVIRHQLGDRMERRFGMRIVYRSLFRFYYIIRNGCYLLTTDYLKGKDRLLFKLLIKKKIAEALLLNRFNKNSFRTVKKAVYNGKNRIFENYEESEK